MVRSLQSRLDEAQRELRQRVDSTAELSALRDTFNEHRLTLEREMAGLQARFNTVLQQQAEKENTQIAQLNTEMETLRVGLNDQMRILNPTPAPTPAPAPAIIPNRHLLPDGYLEVDVPGDNNCLFWSAALGIIIPVVRDQAAFNSVYQRLFGDNGSVEIKNQQTPGRTETIEISAPATMEGVRNMLLTYDRQKETPTKYQGNLLGILVCRRFRNRVVDKMSEIFNEEQRTSIAGAGSWQTYTDGMRETNAWGGGPEIQAIAHLARVNIRLTGAGYTIPQTFPVTGASETLYLVHASAGRGTVNNHYHFGLNLRAGLTPIPIPTPAPDPTPIPAPTPPEPPVIMPVSQPDIQRQLENLRRLRDGWLRIKEERRQLTLQNELVKACEQGNLSAVRTAVEKGAKPGDRNGEDKLPLGAAVWGMNPQIVTFLLEQKRTEPSMTWQECQAHNQIFYGELFAITSFKPVTFADWLILLERMKKSPFLLDYHLRYAQKAWKTNDPTDIVSFEKLRDEYFMVHGLHLTVNGTNGGKWVRQHDDTEKGYNEFRTSIQTRIVQSEREIQPLRQVQVDPSEREIADIDAQINTIEREALVALEREYNQPQVRTFKQKLDELLTGGYSFALRRPSNGELLIKLTTRDNMLAERETIIGQLVNLVTPLQGALRTLGVQDNQYRATPDFREWTLAITAEPSSVLDKIASLLQVSGKDYLPSPAQTRSALFYTPPLPRPGSGPVIEDKKEVICKMQ